MRHTWANRVALAALIIWSMPVAAQDAATAQQQAVQQLLPDVGSTGEKIYTGAQIKEMGGKPPKLLNAPSEPDVAALHSKGIQGEMFYSGYVGADGRMHDVAITKSSRSPELDAVGLRLVNESIFTPAVDTSGKPIAARVVYPVYLWKDSMMTPAFGKKTCEDFVADADWHAATFPEEAPSKLRGWLLANGMVFAGSHALTKKVAKTASFEETYATCKLHPSKQFFDVLLGSKPNQKLR